MKPFLYSEVAKKPSRRKCGEALLTVRCGRTPKSGDGQELRFSIHSKLLAKCGWTAGTLLDLQVGEQGKAILFASDSGRAIAFPTPGTRGYLSLIIPEGIEFPEMDGTAKITRSTSAGRAYFTFPEK